MRILAILITVFSVFLTLVYWGDAAGYGWLVALTVWIDRCFKE
jgi:hypothetical protein